MDTSNNVSRETCASECPNITICDYFLVGHDLAEYGKIRSLKTNANSKSTCPGEHPKGITLLDFVHFH